jgi:hypothetical protein
MKNWMHMATIVMLTLAVPACVGAEGTDELEEDGEESVAQTEEGVSCTWNYILHYNYTDGSGTYRWHASQNLATGKWYIDERRIGGGFYKQYSLTPGWTVCPSSPESITLKSGTQTLVGPHNCLPGGNEEVHLEKQRLLVPQAPFATYECL